MTDAKSKTQAFIEHLRRLRTDRGAMAVLRRSLAADPEDVRAYRYVEPFVSDESGWRRRAYYLVAGLFALHPEESGSTLAEVLGDLWRRDGQRSGLERRFHALLEADPDQLPDRLRRVVAYIASKRAGGLNYVRLLEDLLRWYRPSGRVRQRWAREFYT
jgi:CRISPR system Cascade subunit CasB